MTFCAGLCRALVGKPLRAHGSGPRAQGPGLRAQGSGLKKSFFVWLILVEMFHVFKGHGVVVSHALRMRKAVGSIPSASISGFRV